MANIYLQMAGDFDKLEPMLRLETRQELEGFLQRHQTNFRELRLQAHIKTLSASLGRNILVRCSLNLFTTNGRFHAVEEGFGVEAAIKSALLALRYQVEKHLEIRMESRAKVEGRKALAA